ETLEEYVARVRHTARGQPERMGGGFEALQQARPDQPDEGGFLGNYAAVGLQIPARLIACQGQLRWSEFGRQCPREVLEKAGQDAIKRIFDRDHVGIGESNRNFVTVRPDNTVVWIIPLHEVTGPAHSCRVEYVE